MLSVFFRGPSSEHDHLSPCGRGRRACAAGEGASGVGKCGAGLIAGFFVQVRLALRGPLIRPVGHLLPQGEKECSASFVRGSSSGHDHLSPCGRGRRACAAGEGASGVGKCGAGLAAGFFLQVTLALRAPLICPVGCLPPQGEKDSDRSPFCGKRESIPQLRHIAMRLHLLDHRIGGFCGGQVLAVGRQVGGEGMRVQRAVDGSLDAVGFVVQAQ